MKSILFCFVLILRRHLFVDVFLLVSLTLFFDSTCTFVYVCHLLTVCLPVMSLSAHLYLSVCTCPSPCRHYCINMPESLPKLLLSVKWNSRDEVSQVKSHYNSMEDFSNTFSSTCVSPVSSSFSSSFSDVLFVEGVASDGTRVGSGAPGL